MNYVALLSLVIDFFFNLYMLEPGIFQFLLQENPVRMWWLEKQKRLTSAVSLSSIVICRKRYFNLSHILQYLNCRLQRGIALKNNLTHPKGLFWPLAASLLAWLQWCTGGLQCLVWAWLQVQQSTLLNTPIQRGQGWNRLKTCNQTGQENTDFQPVENL